MSDWDELAVLLAQLFIATLAFVGMFSLVTELIKGTLPL